MQFLVTLLSSQTFAFRNQMSRTLLSQNANKFHNRKTIYEKQLKKYMRIFLLSAILIQICTLVNIMLARI